MTHQDWMRSVWEIYQPDFRRFRIPASRVWDAWKDTKEVPELCVLWAHAFVREYAVPCDVRPPKEFSRFCPDRRVYAGPVIPQVSVAHTRQWKRWRRFFKQATT